MTDGVTEELMLELQLFTVNINDLDERNQVK